MPPLRRAVACLLALALALAGAALAARGDPQKKIKPADQARAKAMLLRAADLPGAKAGRPSSSDDDFYCEALDESDLTLTGEAESPDFERGFTFISSLSQVYESLADANASWRRGVSAAGVKCARDAFRDELRKSGDRLVSFRKIAAPRSAQRSAAFRIVGETMGLRIYLDFVVLMQSRAHTAIVVGSALEPFPRRELNRLSGVVGARMKTAMRGA